MSLTVTPSFKLGDKVHGLYSRYNNAIDDYEQFPYSGTITHDFEDGSYLVQTEASGLLLVEPGYWNLETINLAV